jgi:hypothetical protein
VPSSSGCEIAVLDFKNSPQAGDFSFSTSLLNGTTTYNPDPLVHGRWFVYVSEATGTVNSSSATRYVWTSIEVSLSGGNGGGGGGGGGGPVVTPAPYTGPVLTPPAGVITASAGGKVTIPGSRLGGITKVEIAGLDAQVVVTSEGSIEITVPRGLAPGVYDIVIVSDAGKLTIQDGLTVAAPEPRPSTRLIADNTLKVWVFDAFGSGKVQIKLNGREVAWVNAADAHDPKLRDGRLVRTLTLAAGKNVIEVYVDGKRVERRVATGS